MNQLKFSLANVLVVLATALFGFFCFLSLNFFSLGETVPSIIIATIIAILLSGLAFAAKCMKRTRRNFRICVILEGVFLLLFGIVAYIIVDRPFSHYFAVLSLKEEIRTRVTANITQAESMFAGYEKYANSRENLYKSRLQSVARSKNVNPAEYRDFDFQNDISDSEQIENKLFTLHVQLFPSNYKEMKQVYSAWLAEARHTIDDWWAWTFGVVRTVNSAEKNINEWRDELIRFSAYREKGEEKYHMANNFTYSLSFDDVKDKFENRSNSPWWSILIALLLYLLLLLPYIASKRDTKRLGFKEMFGGRKINEL